MAAYPITVYSKESTIQPNDGREVDVADDGTPRIRSFFAKTLYRLEIVHRFIDETDKDTLDSFYDTNQDLAVTFTETVSGDTYTVYFINRPMIRHESGGWWTVICEMTGTKP